MAKANTKPRRRKAAITVPSGETTKFSVSSASPPRHFSTAANAFPQLPPTIATRTTVRRQILTGADGMSSSERVVTVVTDESRSLRNGCYLLKYTPILSSAPVSNAHYDGTLRIEKNGNSVTASGDLYLHQTPSGPFAPTSTLEPNASDGIPIFSRSNYRFYVRVTQILEGSTSEDSFTLGFELFRLNPASNSWTNEGAFTSLLSWSIGPANFPSPSDYLTGSVKSAAGQIVGNLEVGWVSKYLRRALVEIDRVPASEPPLNNGDAVTWKTVFDAVGWDLTIVESESSIPAPSGDSWSDAEMHAAMLAHRETSDLDSTWRYHILCVKKIDSTPRGIMYDAFGTDSNNVPREGIGIATHWIIPNEDPWGKVKGMRFGTAIAPFFRTALHEIGHAMGLYHNTIDNGIMNTTDVISENAVPPVQFPDNIKWAHAPDDQKRLRHLPDMWVRPGGIAFGLDFSTAPISPDDLIQPANGLVLEVKPLLDTVPLGAPVRAQFSLQNRSTRTLPVPKDLSMKSGVVSGEIVDPSGTVRTFSPIILCVEDQSLQELPPNGQVEDSVTLLRGGRGALFPSPGLYTVNISIDWDVHRAHVGITGTTTVMIGPIESEAHAVAAHKVLSTPDTLLSLVFGGDHLVDGNEAIHAAIENPVLRPHYAVIEAKRIGRRFGHRKADLKAAAELIDESSVMSPPEISRMAGIMKDASAQSAKKMGSLLRKKALTASASPKIIQQVDALA